MLIVDQLGPSKHDQYSDVVDLWRWLVREVLLYVHIIYIYIYIYLRWFITVEKLRQ